MKFWRVHLKILLIIFIIFGVVRIARMLPSRTNKNDFAHYYISSRMLLQGVSPYENYLANQYEAYGFVFDKRINHGTNPPTLIWLFSPLARLAPKQAFLSWAIIQALSLIAILVILKRLLHNRISAETWWVICALTLISSPVYYNFYYSQVQLLLTALVLAAYLLQKSGRHHFALFTITVTEMIKLFPLALVPWFIWRADKKIWGRALYSLEALLIACGVVYLTGPKLWVDFLRYASVVIDANSVNRSFNYSLPSFILNLAYASHDFRVSQGFTSLWLTVGMLAGIAIIILTYVINFFGRPDHDIQFSMLCLSMVIGSITAWGHYLILLIFSLTIGFIEVSNRKSIKLSLLFGVILFSIISAGSESLLFSHHITYNVLNNYIPLYSMLILFVLLSIELMAHKNSLNGSGRPKSLGLICPHSQGKPFP